jgi:hypothetical protein
MIDDDVMIVDGVALADLLPLEDIKSVTHLSLTGNPVTLVVILVPFTLRFSSLLGCLLVSFFTMGHMVDIEKLSAICN